MKHTTAAVLAALALTIVAGCATQSPTPSATADTTTPAATEVETAATTAEPTPTETQTPAPVVGDVVTDTAVIEACDGANAPLGIIAYGELTDGKCPLEMGQRVYVTNDGTALLLDRTQPLPEQVLAEVTAVQHDGVVADSSTEGQAWGQQVVAAISAINTKTGKSTVVIERASGRARCEGPTTTVYLAMVSGGYLHGGRTCSAFATPDESYTDAVAFVSVRDDADTWVVLPYAG